MMIVFDAHVPAELRTAVEPLINKHAKLIPDWCRRLNVRFDDKGDDSFAASTGIDFAYRKASITIRGHWLTADAERREHYVVHELFHLITGPMVNYAFDTIRTATKDNEALCEHVKFQFKEYMEGTVQDSVNMYFANRLALPKDEFP